MREVGREFGLGVPAISRHMKNENGRHTWALAPETQRQIASEIPGGNVAEAMALAGLTGKPLPRPEALDEWTELVLEEMAVGLQMPDAVAKVCPDAMLGEKITGFLSVDPIFQYRARSVHAGLRARMLKQAQSTGTAETQAAIRFLERVWPDDYAPKPKTAANIRDTHVTKADAAKYVAALFEIVRSIVDKKTCEKILIAMQSAGLKAFGGDGS